MISLLCRNIIKSRSKFEFRKLKKNDKLFNFLTVQFGSHRNYLSQTHCPLIFGRSLFKFSSLGCFSLIRDKFVKNIKLMKIRIRMLAGWGVPGH